MNKWSWIKGNYEVTPLTKTFLARWSAQTWERATNLASAVTGSVWTESCVLGHVSGGPSTMFWINNQGNHSSDVLNIFTEGIGKCTAPQGRDSFRCEQGMGTRNRWGHENTPLLGEARQDWCILASFSLTWSSSVARALQKEEAMVIILDSEMHDFGKVNGVRDKDNRLSKNWVWLKLKGTVSPAFPISPSTPTRPSLDQQPLPD